MYSKLNHKEFMFQGVSNLILCATNFDGGSNFVLARRMNALWADERRKVLQYCYETNLKKYDILSVLSPFLQRTSNLELVCKGVFNQSRAITQATRRFYHILKSGKDSTCMVAETIRIHEGIITHFEMDPYHAGISLSVWADFDPKIYKNYHYLNFTL